MQPCATTLCVSGLLAGKHFRWPLDRPVLAIGRAPSNAIHIPDPTVSKHHAEIVRTSEGWRLRDLGSRNGTRVNGARVAEPTLLRAGDEVVIGHATFRITDDADAAAPEEALPPTALAGAHDEREARDASAGSAAARLLQRGFLPAGPPALEGCDVSAFVEPCRDVGGDLYDLWQSPGGAIYILVGDVSGKGMGSVLLMASVVASARVLYEDEPEPDELARRLNRMIHRRTDASLYVTAFIGRLDPTTGQLRYVNAGHPRPLLVESGVRELPASALPLGVSPKAAYVNHTAELRVGARLVVYTDGIPEAQRAGVHFGSAALRERLQETTDQTSESIARAIQGDLDRFLDGTIADDDATLVVVRRTAAADAPTGDIAWVAAA